MNSPDEWEGDGHVTDDLLAAVALQDVPALDDGDTDVARARIHADECADCAAEVRSLRETLSLVLASGPDEMVRPPAGVWQAVATQIEEERDLAAVTALAPGRAGERRSRRGVPVWFAAAAASLTLAIGVGVGTLVAPEDEAAAPVAQLLGTADLATVDAAALPRGAAEVRRHDDRVVLHVQALDLDTGEDGTDGDGTREVWLINTDGERMVSLGLLASGETGDFELTDQLLDDGYRIVDISYEPNDGNPVHSGQSLARGTIEA